MATVNQPAEATRLVVRSAATTIGIFGLFGLKWTEAHLVLPLTRLQGSAAAGLFGAPTVPVEVTRVAGYQYLAGGCPRVHTGITCAGSARSHSAGHARGPTGRRHVTDVVSRRADTWVVMPTTYLFNKQVSLEAITHSWPAGVGPAGQPAFTLRLRREGRFPITIGLVTPHSTYLGTVAELGAAGLAALLLILLAGGLTIRRLVEDPARHRWEAAAFAGIGAAFLIEAISTDLLNCRHYWFLFAVMASRGPHGVRRGR